MKKIMQSYYKPCFFNLSRGHSCYLWHFLPLPIPKSHTQKIWRIYFPELFFKSQNKQFGLRLEFALHLRSRTPSIPPSVGLSWDCFVVKDVSLKRVTLMNWIEFVIFWYSTILWKFYPNEVINNKRLLV